MFSWDKDYRSRLFPIAQEKWSPGVPSISWEQRRGPEVEVHLAAPMQLAGEGNDIHAVRGELLQEGSIGLTLRVSEDGTYESNTLRFWPTLMQRRILSLPYESIFSLARYDDETNR